MYIAVGVYRKFSIFCKYALEL